MKEGGGGKRLDGLKPSKRMKIICRRPLNGFYLLSCIAAYYVKAYYKIFQYIEFVKSKKLVTFKNKSR